MHYCREPPRCVSTVLTGHGELRFATTAIDLGKQQKRWVDFVLFLMYTENMC